MKKILFTFMILLMCLFVVGCGDKEQTNNNEEPKQDEKQTEKQDEKKEDEVIKYTVNFNGTNIANQEIVAGGQLNQPAEPKQDNYIFGGWYLNSTYTEEASFPITVNHDMIIYAKFYSYQQAFEAARNKTIGSGVAGYEFDYSLDASVSYSALALSGHTEGNSKYSTTGEVSFYDEAVNSGALFYDGTKYQIKKGTTLQKISLDENGLLKKYNTEVVDANYNFDSSSFAKAIFEYSSDQLKEIKKTSNSNEYELVTSMNASKVLGIVGNYINNPIIEGVLGSLPETSVSTGMYVTFSNGELKDYRYEMKIDVENIKFNLIYRLSFKNVGKAQTISPKSIAGIAISTSDIQNSYNNINSKLNSYKSQTNSGYDYVIKTGVNFPSKNEINSTFKGSALRKIIDGVVFFHNDIEIDSDYENADLYKASDIADIHIKKTKLSNGEVYNIEKKTLADKTYLVENYVSNNNDSYYALSMLDVINNIVFIQEVNDGGKLKYSIGLSESDVANILDWVNANLDLDPLNTASTDVLIYGNYNKSSIALEDCEFIITLSLGKLESIKLEFNGSYKTALDGSRDFSNSNDATFNFSYEIKFTNDGDSFVPYETVNKAK